jgi:hypothetical protein
LGGLNAASVVSNGNENLGVNTALSRENFNMVRDRVMDELSRKILAHGQTSLLRQPSNDLGMPSMNRTTIVDPNIGVVAVAASDARLFLNRPTMRGPLIGCHNASNSVIAQLPVPSNTDGYRTTNGSFPPHTASNMIATASTATLGRNVLDVNSSYSVGIAGTTPSHVAIINEIERLREQNIAQLMYHIRHSTIPSSMAALGSNTQSQRSEASNGVISSHIAGRNLSIASLLNDATISQLQRHVAERMTADVSDRTRGAM